MDPSLLKRGLSLVTASFSFPGTSRSQESSTQLGGPRASRTPLSGSRAGSRSLHSLSGPTRGDQRGTRACVGLGEEGKPGERGCVYSRRR